MRSSPVMSWSSSAYVKSVRCILFHIFKVIERLSGFWFEGGSSVSRISSLSIFASKFLVSPMLLMLGLIGGV